MKDTINIFILMYNEKGRRLDIMALHKGLAHLELHLCNLCLSTHDIEQGLDLRAKHRQ